MRVIDAQEKLSEINVASFPHIKKKARSEIAKKYRKDAASLIPKKRLSMKEAMEKMRGIGGGR